MKKIIFIFTLAFVLSLYIVPSHAAESDYTIFYVYYNDNKYSGYLFRNSPTPVINSIRYDWGTMLTFTGTYCASEYRNSSLEACIAYMQSSIEYADSHPSYGYEGHTESFGSLDNVNLIMAYGPYTNNTSVDVHEPQPPTPPEPDPESSSWLEDMWDWVMWQLGITDEFSDELKDYIFDEDNSGGHSGGHSFEPITPTPTTVPPTPTPYDLSITDENGNTVYNITGIPSNNITINGGDTYNGSDFDIFEVDWQLRPSGGIVNPKDGINSVMDSNSEYVNEIDTSVVQSSLSVIPSDWFIWIGVLASFPIIAGFISKLLK